ncbi:small multi-drug export protein, partial [Candidatus Woesearchaeota archaeon]|nr:small multi-drug export protein [Candidatus Woesearchaeota archaeon]
MALKFLLSTALLYAIIISMLPFGELRVGIPLAAATGVNILYAFVMCTFANIIMIPFIFLFLDTIHKILMKIKFYERIFKLVVHRVRKKVTKYVEKWGYLGLLIFVSIPLPGSGAWTGVLGAWLFAMDRNKSMIYIAGGVL